MRRGLRSFAKRHWMRRAAEQGEPVPHVEDEDLFVEPPGAEAVARRAAILAAVVARGLIEADESLSDGAAAIADDLAYFDELGLAADAEPDEEALVRAPYGTLADQAVIDATWRAEGVAVLAWALGRLDELPPIDETVDLALLAERVELPWASAADAMLLRSPALRRAPAEIDALGTMLLTPTGACGISCTWIRRRWTTSPGCRGSSGPS